jgi:hypothetical protein
LNALLPFRLRAARHLRRTLFAAATPFALAAQSGTPPPPPVPLQPITAADSAIRIFLLTMGQGDQVYELFGHNAIWVQDPRMPTDIVYNWGVFDFRTPGFLGRFLLGDMRYMMAGETIDNTIATYQHLNRRVWAQELNLTPAEKRALVDYVHWHVRPENAQYRYDYYLDNCSTRVRDAIDRVLGGRLREYLKAIPTDETYRSHSLRLMQGEKLLVTGVDLALGRSTDTKLSADQASFLPVQLMKHIRDFKLDGGSRPLVGREFLIADANRPAEAEQPPKMWKGLLLVGLALAALVLILSLHAGRFSPRAGAIVIGTLAGLYGLIGTVITLLVTITDHVAAHANENMFMLNPLWLVMAVAIPILILKRRGVAIARASTAAVTILSLCAVLIHLTGLSRQPNWDVIALLLPSQLVIAHVARIYFTFDAVGFAPLWGKVKNST